MFEDHDDSTVIFFTLLNSFVHLSSILLSAENLKFCVFLLVLFLLKLPLSVYFVLLLFLFSAVIILLKFHKS